MADALDTITVKDPTGELGTLSKSELPIALKHRFTIPDNAEILAHNNHIEFGGTANALKTFGEAAAGTATFGTSRELENALHITTPEAQAGRAKEHPVARTLGDVTGIAAPLGAEAAGLKIFNPVAKIAGVGTEAGEIASQMAPEAIANMGRTGAQGAAEGLFYGAGQTINEHAMGDPSVNGEKLLHNMGYGALLGGGVGGALGAAEDLVPRVVDVAKDSLAKAKASLFGTPEDAGIFGKSFAKASSLVSGNPEESILDMWKNRSSLLENPKTQQKAYSEFSSNLQDHLEKLKSAISTANKEIKTNIEDGFLSEDMNRAEALAESQNKLSQILNRKNDFAKSFLKKYGIEKAEVDPDKIQTFLSQANTIRSEAKAKALDDFFDSSQETISQIENAFKNAPNKIFSKTAVGNLINKDQGIGLSEAGAFIAGMHNPALGATIEGVNMLKNPSLTIQRMAKLEQMITKTTSILAKGAKSIFKTGTKASESFSGYSGERLTANMHNQREMNINKFNSNVQYASDTLHNSTEGVHISAPQTAASLRSSVVRASEFLQSKLPSTSFGPIEEKADLPKSALAKFDRYYQTVENPMLVFKNIKNGSVMPEQIETLSVVYPKLYEEMKQEVFNQMVEHAEVIGKGTIPYKTKLGLSQFLREPIHPSLTPQAILNNQAMIASLASANQSKAQPGIPQHALKVRAKGLDKMTMADRASNDYSAISDKV